MRSDHSAGETKQVLDDCRKKVLVAAPAILDSLITKATEGSYQHAKFLFDLLEPAASKRAAKDDDVDDLPGPSLAEMLIERLQLVETQDANDSAKATLT